MSLRPVNQGKLTWRTDTAQGADETGDAIATDESQQNLLVIVGQRPHGLVVLNREGKHDAGVHTARVV